MPHKDIESSKRYFREYYLRNRENKLEYSKKYREGNLDLVAAAKKRCYERAKDSPDFKTSISVYGKQRRQKNLEHVKSIERKSREKRRDRIFAYQWKHRGTLERKARDFVNGAVKSKKIPSVSTCVCEKCGEPAKEYHHKSYKREDWLKITPVCYQCHKDIHVRAIL